MIYIDGVDISVFMKSGLLIMDKKIAKIGFSELQFDTGEIKMNYARGPNTGPALVLIPGQSASWENFSKVLIPLARRFEIFAVDIRGHGKSGWTPGNYTFDSIGQDLVAFLKSVVARPAIISGNSSGGLIAIWLAVKVPHLVHAIIPEDPPLFSADWPRIKKEFVYYVLQSAVEIANVMRNSTSVDELSQALQKIEKPIAGKDQAGRVPRWATNLMAKLIRRYQAKSKGLSTKRSFAPRKLKQVVEAMTRYDPDFSQAWVDGRIYQGLNHEDFLPRVSCPMLLMHANWFRHPKYGLSGAMDDADAERVCSLVPHCQYRRINSGHVIHSDKPVIFVRELEDFANKIH